MRNRKLALPVAALGVVYGDIGTSPLYAIREAFLGEQSVAASPENVLGVLSLVLWSLLLVISLKYLTFILRADHDGEGGILVLMELVRRRTERSSRRFVLGLGLFGAALLYGDGIITPAISVLSAFEGLDVVADQNLSQLVLPGTIAVLCLLFLMQRLGAGGIGQLFGPVMLVWFIVLAIGGAAAILAHPDVLAAANPMYAFNFLATSGFAGIAILGIVFLVVTGGEALYADLGQFGRGPIVTSWYGVALPGLTLNYFGQGALILERGGALSNSFYELYPPWALIPMVALATAATVIASQAIISGVFSLTFQGIRLGYFPRLKIRHTSSDMRGQIYIPVVNWLLLAATVALVLAFRDSGRLAGAYGVAIAATMTITTVLYMNFLLRSHRRPIVLGACMLFLLVDLGFLAATAGKIPSGGWLPLIVASAVTFVMTTWHRGRELEASTVRDRAQGLQDFLAAHSGGMYRRVPGQAVYLTEKTHGTPHVFERNLRHNRALHRFVVIYTARTTRRPYAKREKRLIVQRVRDDIVRVIAYYGFMEHVDVPADLSAASRDHDLGIDPKRVTYFVGDEIPLAIDDVGMPAWRAWFFALMQRNSPSFIQSFRLPPDQVVEIGTRVPV